MLFWRNFKLSHTASSVDIWSTSTRKPSCPPLRVITVIAWFNLLVIVALVVRTSANIRASGLIAGHKINEQILCWRNIYLHLCKKPRKSRWHRITYIGEINDIINNGNYRSGVSDFFMLLIKACQKKQTLYLLRLFWNPCFSQMKRTSQAYRFGVGTFAPKIME